MKSKNAGLYIFLALIKIVKKLLLHACEGAKNNFQKKLKVKMQVLWSTCLVSCLLRQIIITCLNNALKLCMQKMHEQILYADLIHGAYRIYSFLKVGISMNFTNVTNLGLAGGNTIKIHLTIRFVTERN